MNKRNRCQSHGCKENKTQCCPSQMMPSPYGASQFSPQMMPSQYGPSQLSPQMMPSQFDPSQLSPQMMPSQFDPSQLSPQMMPSQYGPTQMMPTQYAPPQFSPEMQFVRTNVMHTVVPHIHPAHITTVNKHIIDHQHHFPVTESVVNECCENHIMCDTPHHQKCDKK